MGKFQIEDIPVTTAEVQKKHTFSGKWDVATLGRRLSFSTSDASHRKFPRGQGVGKNGQKIDPLKTVFIEPFPDVDGPAYCRTMFNDAIFLKTRGPGAPDPATGKVILANQSRHNAWLRSMLKARLGLDSGVGVFHDDYVQNSDGSVTQSWRCMVPNASPTKVHSLLLDIARGSIIGPLGRYPLVLGQNDWTVNGCGAVYNNSWDGPQNAADWNRRTQNRAQYVDNNSMVSDTTHTYWIDVWAPVGGVEQRLRSRVKIYGKVDMMLAVASLRKLHGCQLENFIQSAQYNIESMLKHPLVRELGSLRVELSFYDLIPDTLEAIASALYNSAYILIGMHGTHESLAELSRNYLRKDHHEVITIQLDRTTGAYSGALIRWSYSQTDRSNGTRIGGQSGTSDKNRFYRELDTCVRYCTQGIYPLRCYYFEHAKNSDGKSITTLLRAGTLETDPTFTGCLHPPGDHRSRSARRDSLRNTVDHTVRRFGDDLDLDFISLSIPDYRPAPRRMIWDPAPVDPQTYNLETLQTQARRKAKKEQYKLAKAAKDLIKLQKQVEKDKGIDLLRARRRHISQFFSVPVADLTPGTEKVGYVSKYAKVGDQQAPGYVVKVGSYSYKITAELFLDFHQYLEKNPPVPIKLVVTFEGFDSDKRAVYRLDYGPVPEYQY